MTSNIEEHINSVIYIVANELSLSDWCYTKEKFECIGQNYFGLLVPVVLFAKNKPKDTIFKLVLKLAPFDEKFRVSGAVTAFFAKEIFVYTTLLQKYSELQQNYPTNLQYIMPHCYYVSKEYCKEVIVMKDMTSDGYKPFKDTFLDLEHVSLALISLAKFHALSFIFKQKNLILYQEVTQTCSPLSHKNNERFMQILKDRLEKALLKFEGSDYVPLFEKLNKNHIDLVEAKSNAVKKVCVCHADIWKENILYKYENNKPISACIIDYQTVQMSSPAYDVLYLITSSTNKRLRKQYYTKLLEIYYQTFDQILDLAGLKSEEVYSRQMFEHDLKAVGPACFIIANTALWLANGLQEEGHVKSKSVLSTEEEKLKAVHCYKTVIKDIIDDYNYYGYLDVI